MPQPHRTWSPLLCVDRATRSALTVPTEQPAGDPSTPPIHVVDAASPLAALADALAQDLQVLRHRDAPIPQQKARLTRIGGRCPTHGTLLEFDPFKPHDHWCTVCAKTYQATEHDDWWAMNAQLWTVERAVHAATLHALRGDSQHALLAASILRRYVDQYEQWPNSDNVLGPSRPFFSTYLESIWLLNVCHAVALLEGTTNTWTDLDGSRLRERVIAPSMRLIDGFSEGRSNRQVWNEVAVCSAWTMLGQQDAARQRLCSPHGIVGLIDEGLDDNGFWYEGENYHLFAHRGLWYGVELLRALGEPLTPERDAKYSAGFVAPFLGLLPDETFPSRRDAQYASSIRQWRTAEWCELGWAHTHDPRSAVLLAALYDGSTPRGATGRARSTADAERNTAPTALTRADLSWRALLMADAHVPRETGGALSSVCLPSQGLAILRRDAGDTYVALEGGKSGGGHGHPDQLALTLQTGDARWLEDPGTGSYVEPRLAWYRSTFAHYAPLFDGQTQSAAEAQLVAFEDRESFGWIIKRIDDVIAGVSVERAVLVAEGYLIDVLEWDAARNVELTLPIAAVAASTDAHVTAPVDNDTETTTAPEGKTAPHVTETEDRGMAFVRDVVRLHEGQQFACVVTPCFARGSYDDRPLAHARARLWVGTSHRATVSRGVAPAMPGQGDVQRHWITTQAPQGRVISLWSWPTGNAPLGTVESVALTAQDGCSARITLRDGTQCSHRLDRQGDGRRWHVETRGSGEAANVEFVVAQTSPRQLDAQPVKEGKDVPAAQATSPVARILRVPLLPQSARDQLAGDPVRGALALDLGEGHYIPTELPWRDAGRPTARLQLMTTGTDFIVDVAVHTGPPLSSFEHQENPLDNEVHDVNADGLQWYFGPVPASTEACAWTAAGLVVPVVGASSGLATRQTRLSADLLPTIEARRTTRGWAMRLRWHRSALPGAGRSPLRFELVVNERPPERERRRGQLSLSGGGGYGYLAGSRRPPSHAVHLIFPLDP